MFNIKRWIRAKTESSTVLNSPETHSTGRPKTMMMKKLLQPLQSVSGPLWVHGEKTQLSSPCKYYSTLRSLHSAATQVGKEAPVVSGPQ